MPGLLVLSGPSGVGKTTITTELTKDSRFVRSTSVTTRLSRQGEQEGIDYYFITNDEFDTYKKAKLLLEYNEIFGNKYGTLKQKVREAIQNDKVIILTIDVEGGSRIKETEPDAVLVFVAPPSLDELKERLASRSTEPEEIAKRLARAEKEIKCAAQYYDCVTVNSDLQSCVRSIKQYCEKRKII